MMSIMRIMKAFASVERIHEYSSSTDHEKPWLTPAAPANWPQSGQLEFNNVKVRYRKNLPLTLKGLTFSVDSCQKVGIVGRTGSGKSTLLLALVRILEISEECEKNEISFIKLDGVKLSSIGLHEVRKNVVIIPQDPFLLEGSLRHNVDPLQQFSDTEVISALKKAHVLDTLNTPNEQSKIRTSSNLEHKDPRTQKNSNSEIEEISNLSERKALKTHSNTS